MGTRYLIVVGDPTTGGGQALEGLADFNIKCLDGSLRGLVCVGHAVLCGQCGPTRVTQGASHFFVNEPAAYDGCLLACGHKLIAASQRGARVSVNAASHEDEAVTSLSGRLALVGHTQAYDLTFSVTSEETGLPLSGVKYRITLDSGRSTEGVTDEHGLTQTIYSNSPEFATMEVLHDTKPAESATCSGADTCSC